MNKIYPFCCILVLLVLCSLDVLSQKINKDILSCIIKNDSIYYSNNKMPKYEQRKYLKKIKHEYKCIIDIITTSYLNVKTSKDSMLYFLKEYNVNVNYGRVWNSDFVLVYKVSNDGSIVIYSKDKNPEMYKLNVYQKKMTHYIETGDFLTIDSLSKKKKSTESSLIFANRIQYKPIFVCQYIYFYEFF